MNEWAQAYGDKCTFLCICVDGSRQASQLAGAMGKELKLSHCVNGYVDNRGSLPSRGQLGCNGFIVFDKQGAVVADKTSAYLQVRSLAFAHVRALVDALVAGHSAPKVCPGMEITVTNLTSAAGAAINGQRAMCLAVPEDPADHITIRINKSGKKLMVQPNNVLEMGTTAEESDSEPAVDEDAAACTTGS